MIERCSTTRPRPRGGSIARIPRDLETIVLKAIAKEPGDRYATALAMAEDLERFLDDRRSWRGGARRSNRVGDGAAAIRSWWRRWSPPRRPRSPWPSRRPRWPGSSASSATRSPTIWRDAPLRGARATPRIDGRREELVESLTDRARVMRLSRQAGQRFEGLAALWRAAEIARELGLARKRLDPIRDEAIACLALPDVRPEPGGRVVRRPAGPSRSHSTPP